MSELKAISGHEIREDIDYNTRGVDPEDKEWRNYGKELCDTLYYLKSEADKVIAEKDKEIMELKGQVNGFQNRSNLWHYNAVEEHKKFVQADLKITKLKEKHKTEVKDLLCLIRDKENNFNRAFDSEEKELRHHKYKRCLAMAKWCASRVVVWATEGNEKKSDLYWKWKEKWRELAEKFKPNKEAK